MDILKGRGFAQDEPMAGTSIKTTILRLDNFASAPIALDAATERALEQRGAWSFRDFPVVMAPALPIGEIAMVPTDTLIQEIAHLIAATFGLPYAEAAHTVDMYLRQTGERENKRGTGDDTRS